MGASTVVIVDDHVLFREALRRLIENDRSFRVAGEASDGHSAIALAHELRPDILLLDLAMPGMNGLQVLQEIGPLVPPIRPLLLTAEGTSADVLEAVLLGARGAVMKEAATEQLFRSMHAVMAGQYWIGRSSVARVIDLMRRRQAPSPVPAASSLSALTSRELEIVSAIADGASNGDIAGRLGISPKTVKHHLTNIFAKLGVTNRLELALLAIEHPMDGRTLH